MAAPVATPTEPWPAPRKARAKTCPKNSPDIFILKSKCEFCGADFGENFGGSTRGRLWGKIWGADAGAQDDPQ